MNLKDKNLNNEISRDFLIEMMPKNSVMLEIGTWMGEFAQELYTKNKPQKMYLLDPYKYFETFDKSCYGNKDMNQQKMDEIYQYVLDMFSAGIEDGSVEVIRNVSGKVSYMFEDEYFDWVYIDGNHSYEYVKKDLNLYFPKVKVGGYITGDDYGVKGWWNNGVKKAVTEFINKNKTKLKLVAIKNRQYILQKIAK
jgi:hypothetical protein